MNSKLAIAAVVLALTLAPATPAAALEWGLGTELGGSIFIPADPDANGVATFSWPMLGPGLYQVGGLRVSFRGRNPVHEVWLGSAYSSLTSGGHNTSRLMGAGNYQYNFAAAGRVSPFVTAGLGVVDYSHSSASGASVLYGGGGGLAWRVSDGAGRLRAELRYDQQNEARSQGGVVVPKGGVFEVKFGFDLWIR